MRYWYIIRELLQFLFAQESNKSCSTLHSMVCSQRSCAVLSHCFIDCTCAWESGFFCLQACGKRNQLKNNCINYKIHDLHNLSLKLMVSHELLRWKLEMHILLQQNDMQSKQNNCGVDLTLTCKMVPLLLLVYNSVIFWSTGTTRAGWVGLLL